MRSTILYALLALALSVSAGYAQGGADVASFPSQARGFNAATVYRSSGLDTINAYNGNLVVQLPLGGRYRAGGALAYGLSLVYNANNWDFENGGECAADGGDDDPFLVPLDIAMPAFASNAGMGWTVSMGRLLLPNQRPLNTRTGYWVYLGPDGSRRGLYDVLHPGVGRAGQSYSNDGSYLRMRSEDASGAPACHLAMASTASDCRIYLDFPDGVSHEFTDQGGAGAPDWRVERMVDRFGNQVTISYGDDAWEIRDSAGGAARTHTVHFAGGAPRTWRRVSAVDVAAFDGAVAHYAFAYQLAVPIERHRYDFSLSALNCVPPGGAPGRFDPVPVDLLERVVLPDQSSYRMSYYAHDDQGQGEKSGALESLELPTLGRLTWTYQVYRFALHRPGGNVQTLADDLAPNYHWGVREKRRYGRQGEALGRWTYTQSRSDHEAPQDQDPNDSGDRPCFYTTRVDLPSRQGGPRDFEVHYFYGTLGQGEDFVQRNLPYTRCDPLTGAWDQDPPYLSRQLFSGASPGSPVRSVWVDYESDGTGAGSTFEREHRLLQERTVYHLDEDHYTEVRWQGFDGLGHFRRRIRSSDFPHGAREQAVFTNYNPVASPLPADHEPWLLDLYDRVEVRQDGGALARTHLCFDAATGFLEGRRKERQASGEGDLLVRFDADDSGQPWRERYYGGDDQALHAAGCDADAAAGLEPSYELVRRFRHGELSCERYADGDEALTASDQVRCDGETLMVLADRSIDRSSGLVASERDVSGLETVFDYDRLGRLTAEMPEEGAWVSHRYPPASASEDARYRVSACAHGALGCSGAGALLENVYAYDGLGRLIEESRRVAGVAGSAQAVRARRYDGRGALSDLESWHYPGDPVFATRFQDFDRFDRARRVIRPDGGTTTFTFTGVRLSTRTTPVATAAGLRDAEVMETRDGFARLIEVVEPSGAGGAGVATTYGYDEGDRLEAVCVGDDDRDAATCPGQARGFVYDRRGLLQRESHPELGGTGTMVYEHDARGNRVRANLQGAAALERTYVYDRAGRPTQVWGSDGLLQEYVYARGNGGGGDRSRGRLVMAKGHNRVRRPSHPDAERDVVVTETWRRAGLGGRLSRYAVRAVDGPTLVSEVPRRDDLGGALELLYPECRRPPCAELGPAPLHHMARRHGALIGVEGFVEHVGYHADGRLAVLERSNGTSDEHRRSPAAGPVLDTIAVTGVGAGGDWIHGPYRYDPAGNVTAIGTAHGEDRYRYDLVERLTDAETATAAGRSVRGYRYDAFGNLTAVERDGALELLDVDARNRLTAAAGASYDAAGNATALRFGDGGPRFHFTYDPLRRMRSQRQEGGGVDRWFLYTASGERFATLDLTRGEERFTPRGAAGQVLTRVRSDAAGWAWEEDYLWADSAQVAAVVSGAAGPEIRHFHLDHLGTTRLITDGAGERVALSDYGPFGELLYTTAGAEIDRLQFTGHERDPTGDRRADLDYLHARYRSPRLGRFLSIDPITGSAPAPQSWNRYAYGLNNPLRYVDPDGRSNVDYHELESKIGPVAFMVWLRLDSPLAKTEKAMLYGAGAGVGLASAAAVDVFMWPLRLIPRVNEPFEKMGGPDSPNGGLFPLTGVAYEGLKEGGERFLGLGESGHDGEVETDGEAAEEVIDPQTGEPVVIDDEITVTAQAVQPMVSP